MKHYAGPGIDSIRQRKRILHAHMIRVQTVCKGKQQTKLAGKKLTKYD